MMEYSPSPGVARSKLDREEIDDPCTINRTGNELRPRGGGPTRLRNKASFTFPFMAQYSDCQIFSVPGAFSAGTAPLAAIQSAAASAAPPLASARPISVRREIRRFPALMHASV